MRYDAGVVVGTDGSDGAAAALEWAARAAELRNVPLCIVHCPDYQRHLPGRPDPGRDGVRSAVELLHAAVERVTDMHPALTVYDELVPEHPPLGLVRFASNARLLVVGASGRARLDGLLGSTALAVTEHAPCPVAVVRPRRSQAGPFCDHVVVGVDGSPASNAALEFGFAEATMRREPLAVVHVPTYDALEREYAKSAYDIFTEKPSRAMISEMVQSVAPRYPGVMVVERVIGGSPGKDLARVSAGAEVLVVGARGRGGFTGMLLGSVSHSMMRRAPCPVVVVPPVGSDRQRPGRGVAATQGAGR